MRKYLTVKANKVDMDHLGVTYNEESEWEGIVTIKLTFNRLKDPESNVPETLLVLKVRNKTAENFLKAFQKANQDVQDKFSFLWLIEEDYGGMCGTVPELVPEPVVPEYSPNCIQKENVKALLQTILFE